MQLEVEDLNRSWVNEFSFNVLKKFNLNIIFKISDAKNKIVRTYVLYMLNKQSFLPPKLTSTLYMPTTLVIYILTRISLKLHIILQSISLELLCL